MDEYTTLEQVKIRLKQFHIETVTDEDGVTSDVVVFDQKEDNPYMYNGVKEVLGQEFADDMVRRYKANKWTISYSYTGGGLNDKIDYAIKESDDGKFFLLKTISPYGGSINACYFKDGKPYICKKELQ